MVHVHENEGMTIRNTLILFKIQKPIKQDNKHSLTPVKQVIQSNFIYFLILESMVTYTFGP